MKILLLSTAAFLVSLATGKILVSQFAAQETAVGAAGYDQITGSHSTAAAKTRTFPVRVPVVASTLLEHIVWERKLWKILPADFAREFEEEARTATNSNRLFRFLSIWQERDPDGLIAWAKTQPESVSIGGGGQQIGLSQYVLAAATRKDPEGAWKLAASLSSNSHFLDVNRGRVIGLLFGQDPEAARTFVRKHRDETAAFGQGNIGWYGLDPQKALPVAMELPPGPVRTSIVAELARYYGERPDAIPGAAEWFHSLTSEHRKEVSALPSGDTFYRISDAHRQQLKEVWPAPVGE